jgi:hypothetical protein
MSAPLILALTAVLDPLTLEDHLKRVPPRRWPEVRHIEYRPLKRHRTRCTLEISFQTAQGSTRLIGKVYAADRADLYRAMGEIRRAGFGSEDAFSIPEPVAWIAELGLLLQEKIEGRRAREVLVAGSDADRAAAAECCSLWLARFHARAPLQGPVYHVADHLTVLERCSQALVDLGRPLADKAARLWRRLEAAAQGLDTIELCAGHGHYTCGQILLAEGRTVALDWDGYSVADPCRDVASFLVHLKRTGLGNPGALPALDRAAAAFLTTYLASGRSDVGARLAFHQAAIFTERADHDARKQSRGWRERAGGMLDEGLRVLEGEG